MVDEKAKSQLLYEVAAERICHAGVADRSERDLRESPLGLRIAEPLTNRLAEATTTD